MKCPYTWFRSVFSLSEKIGSRPDLPAENLYVTVVKSGEEKVRVALPARSARWLIELIPSDVVQKIRDEKIPLDEMLDDLKNTEILLPRRIFSLTEPHRQVMVWLE